MRNRTRIAASIGVAAMLAVAGASAAWAHVTVDPSEAAKGGFTTLTFRVPNETDHANTVKLDVSFPGDHPLASVSVRPKAGWTVDVKKAPLATPVTTDDGGTVTDAVSEIVWSGGTIKPGEFDEFEVSVGPLPDDVDALKFPAVQTYDDGSTVAWIQDTIAGQPEPDHPAPVLHLNAASESSTSGSSGSSASSPSGTVVKKEADNTLAIVAIVIAVLALVASIIGLARGRSRAATT